MINNNWNQESIIELCRGARDIPYGENWIKFYAAIFDTKKHTVMNYGPWTMREDEFIINNYEIMKYQDISKHLRRTVKSVTKRVYMLKREGKI